MGRCWRRRFSGLSPSHASADRRRCAAGRAPGTGLRSPETGRQNRGYRALTRQQRPVVRPLNALFFSHECLTVTSRVSPCELRCPLARGGVQQTTGLARDEMCCAAAGAFLSAAMGRSPSACLGGPSPQGSSPMLAAPHLSRTLAAGSGVEITRRAASSTGSDPS